MDPNVTQIVIKLLEIFGPALAGFLAGLHAPQPQYMTKPQDKP